MTCTGQQYYCSVSSKLSDSALGLISPGTEPMCILRGQIEDGAQFPIVMHLVHFLQEMQ